ncbi:hypothetical protein KU710_22995, partial [Salmonella enterica subsp. enterica serovar Give]|nr:hypothetical protein [Salmonella enterica subsp. enterica serovar Give]
MSYAQPSPPISQIDFSTSASASFNSSSTPYTTDANGRGPAWANSLFEDNAEFGLGFRLSVDQHRARV